MNRVEFFKIVEQFTTHWNRIDDKNVEICFSGYRPQVAWDCEKELMKSGASYMSVDFDDHCGKTVIKVREPKFND